MLMNILTLIAIFAGPIVAIQLEKRLEARRATRNRKLHIFRELMITRASRLSARHVEALNAIQMEFTGVGDEGKVVDAWRLYLNHMSIPGPPDLNAWGAKASELLVELLHVMGACLGYHFPKDRIQSETYAPRLFEEVEAEQTELRKVCLAAFKGSGHLTVHVEP